MVPLKQPKGASNRQRTKRAQELRKRMPKVGTRKPERDSGFLQKKQKALIRPTLTKKVPTKEVPTKEVNPRQKAAKELPLRAKKQPRTKEDMKKMQEELFKPKKAAPKSKRVAPSHTVDDNTKTP